VWLAGVVSLVMPVVGAAVMLYGSYEVARNNSNGWWWVSGGAALIVADFIFDWLWAHSKHAKSDEPHLNRRAAQLVDQLVIVVEPIGADSRGKVRAADTVWAAEGTAAEAGTQVRVTGCTGNVLTVEKV
jgi:membrane protein implicated in regulation of membrane protease activity